MICTGTRIHIKGADGIDDDGIVLDSFVSINGQHIKIKLNTPIPGFSGHGLVDTVWVSVRAYDILLVDGNRS
jgi:hypothetical protein